MQHGEHDTVDVPRDHRVDHRAQRLGILLRVGQEDLVSSAQRAASMGARCDPA